MINPQKPVECEVMDFDMFGGGGWGISRSFPIRVAPLNLDEFLSKNPAPR